MDEERLDEKVKRIMDFVSKNFLGYGLPIEIFWNNGECCIIYCGYYNHDKSDEHNLFLSNNSFYFPGLLLNTNRIPSFLSLSGDIIDWRYIKKITFEKKEYKFDDKGNVS